MGDKWICDDECGWKGDYPVVIPSHIFMGTEEDETLEEYIETCPNCGLKVQAIHNPDNVENMNRFWGIAIKHL